ncbi:MAG: antitoxin Xre/MbcA/ParS toxin-binding domain-containing protein, partial [Pseudomonadales bacterium]
AMFTPHAKYTQSASVRALNQVGGILDTHITGIVDMVRIVQHGINPDAVEALVKLGFSRGDIAWIVPQRTLTHRRQKKERLTAEESGRWLRAAKIQALAKVVMGEDEKAIQWLHKKRKAFDNMSAMELMQTEAGGQLVEEYLGQLDTGYYA